MGKAILQSFFRLLVALQILALSAAGQAANPASASFAPDCIAISENDTAFSDMTPVKASPATWQCSEKSWRANVPSVWLRFEAQAWQDENRPRYFFSRIARFVSISFAAIDADGSMRTVRYTEQDGEPFAGGPVFRLPLPEVTSETQTLLVRIEQPHSVPLISEARLSPAPENANWSQLDMMLLAVVIGMLILPLLFDASFYIVLRERFVLLHAGLVVTMMAYVLLAGGLISVFVTLPLVILAVGAPLAWAIGSALAAFFLAAFLEDGVQSTFMRRLTIGTAVFTLVVPGLCSLQLAAMHPYDDQAYFIAFLVTIAVYTLAIVRAVMKGSRSARFVAAAWLPIMIASIERLLRGLGVYVGPSTLDQGLYIATGLEVIMMSLAVADRFFAIKRERDEAVAEAGMLEQLSTRDSLTGLLNRRAVAGRFERLHAAGFHTFALVDLDRFKTINDRFGHKVGDDVLVAVGEALRGDEERSTIGVRMGGEEFVVLLRGRNALQRAEALRQSIPLRIAKTVPGLDQPITASMGVIVLPKMGGNVNSFADLYARADAMMYQAKESGRNRMYYEKLTVFDSPPPARKPAAKVA